MNSDICPVCGRQLQKGNQAYVTLGFDSYKIIDDRRTYDWEVHARQMKICSDCGKHIQWQLGLSDNWESGE